jgi:hypothetical protein
VGGGGVVDGLMDHGLGVGREDLYPVCLLPGDLFLYW